MAQDIVQGMFGLSPNQVAQQQWMQTNEAADKFAQLDPFQRANSLMFKGGSGLAQAGAGMLGIENPQIAEANARQAAMTDLDITSPEKILERAAQVTDPRIKMQLQMLAQQKMAEQQKLKTEASKTALAERKQDFMENQAFELKKMEAEARIRQNDQRIEDARTTAKERIELMRENNQIKLLLGQMANSIAQQKVEGKKDKAAEKADASKEGLSSTLDSLQSAYDSLNMEGGLPSKNRNVLSNIGSYSASTGMGQTMGRMIGSKEQSYRDIINSSRMMLLNDIKNASGMTAQQMNSNVELQNWLKALGDPTVGYETATEIISNIRKKFIDGKAKAPAESKGGWAIRPKG